MEFLLITILTQYSPPQFKRGNLYQNGAHNNAHAHLSSIKKDYGTSQHINPVFKCRTYMQVIKIAICIAQVNNTRKHA